jgi:hypothetical protein
MCGKGSNTTSTSSSTSASPQATSAYQNLLNRAQGVAATPYQAYTGELTAPINSQQQAGISGINAASGQAQPAINQALGLAAGAANPLTAAQIQQYQNPYTQNVIDATQAQFNNQNAQQQQQLTGNAISQGALGGNRVGVAQANLAGQESLAQAPVIAGLYSNSYQQGLAAAGQQFQQNPLAAAGSIANFGLAGQNAALTGAGAQLGAGTVQQQTQQQIDAANQAQYNQQQAYPYQQTQWLAGLDTGVGPGLGSSSTGQTTAPAPNQFSQYAGLGLAAASFLARGGRVSLGDIQHFDGGGVAKSPWGNAPSWIPQISLGNAAPHAGSAPSAPSNTAPTFDYSKIIAANNKDSNGLLSGPSYGGGNVFTDAYGGSSSSPLEGLSAADYGEGFARGGVAGYADGGDTFNDRFTSRSSDEGDVDRNGDQNRAIAYDLLRKGQGIQMPGPNPASGSNQGVTAAPMPDQAAVDDWRAGNPLPGSGVAPAASSDDDEPLPSEITGKPNVAPVGVGGADSAAMSFAPGVGSAAPTTNPMGATWQPTSQPSPDNGGGLGLFNMSHNARSGLLAAGLGMLASRSPNLGNAIGEGGLAGMSAYGAGEERDRKVAEEAAKLSREAQQHAEEMKLKTDTLGENIRHNKAAEATAADKSKFTPIGSVVSGGESHPLVMDQMSGKIMDAATGKPPQTGDKIMTKDAGGKNDPAIAEHISHAIMKGEQPPTLTGLYGQSGAVRSKLDENGFDLAKAQIEWSRAQKQVATLNGPQMTRFVGLANSVNSTIDEVRELSKQMNNSGIPKLNAAKLAIYMQAEGNSPNGKLAARYVGAVNTLKEEFANLANGGYAPTEPAWKLANEQINGNYGVDQLGAGLDEVQRLINYRVHAIPGLDTMGAGAANRYTGQGSSSATTTATTPPATSTPPPGAVSQRPDRTGKMWYFGADGQLLPGQ